MKRYNSPATLYSRLEGRLHRVSARITSTAYLIADAVVIPRCFLLEVDVQTSLLSDGNHQSMLVRTRHESFYVLEVISSFV